MDKTWIEIVPPVAPPADHNLWLSALLLVVLLVFSLLVHYQRHPRTRARRQLRRLQRALLRRGIPPREVGFMLADILRHRYTTARLDRLEFPQHRSRWNAFVRQLQQYQYANGTPSKNAMAQLLEEAREWLQR